MSIVETRTAATHSPASVGRNAAILAAATLFCKAGSFAVVPFILRAFSRQDYGAYSAAFAYAGLLGMFAYFGMNPIVIRDIARGERAKGWVLFHCTALRVVFLAASAVGLVILGYFQHFSPLMWTLAWTAFAVMSFDAVSGALKASMQAEGRFGLMASVEVVRKAGQWILAIAVILAGAGITMLALAAAAAGLVSMFAALYMGMSRQDFADMGFAPQYAVRMLRLAAPMGVSAAFLLALERVDIWVLDSLRGVEEVGIYAAGTAFKPDFLVQSVVWALMPLAFQLGKENRAALASAVTRTARYLLIIGAFIAIGFFSGGGTVLPLLAGGQYMDSIWVFRLMGLSVPFVFVSFLYLHALTAVDRQAVAMAIFAGGLAVNVVIDLALVPSMGATGAIIGTLSTEILIAVAAFFCVRRFVGSAFKRRDMATLICVAAAAGVTAIVGLQGVRDLGAIAMAVFAVALVGFKAVTGDDLRALVGSFLPKYRR